MKNLIFLLFFIPFFGTAQERFNRQLDLEFPFHTLTSVYPTDSCYYATGAQQALNNIPNQFTLSGESQTEYNHFNTLKSMQISALQNGTTDAQLVAANQIALTQVADAGEYYASKQAKLLLNEVNGTTYFPEVNLPGGNQQNMMAPPLQDGTISVEANSVVAVPNPAKDMAVFHYSLLEESNNFNLLVTSIDGRAVWQSELERQSGQVRWDLGSLTEGIYFYHLVKDGKVIFTEKLVIVR